MKKYWLCLVLALVLVLAGLPVLAAETPQMVSSQALVDKMKAREGFSATPYWDYSHYSIGYGTTCPDDKVDYYKKNPMSTAEAEAEFKKALGSFEKSVRDFAAKYNLTLKQNQFDALVSFTYNCGAAWMSSTSGYFNNAVRRGIGDAELLYGMALYSTAGGQYILIGRRLWECNIYINGDYGTGAKGSYPDSFRWVFLDGNGGKVRYKICAFDTGMGFQPPVAFEDIPTGVDKNGKPFAYTFAGWYTEDGKKVTVLDERYERNQYLYAKWLDPEGKELTDAAPDQVFPVGATANTGANIRRGPGTNYAKNGDLVAGQRYTVTSHVRGEFVTSYGSDVWCKIGTDQWVLKTFLDYDTEGVPEPEFPKAATIVNVNSAVNVRKGPSTSYDKNGTVKKGAAVSVLAEVEGKKVNGTNIWCKIAEDKYINKYYVRYDEDSLASLTLVKGPDVTQVHQPVVEPDYEGSVLLAVYKSGKAKALTVTRSMVSGFNGSKLGSQTVKATYEDKTVSFQVKVLPPVVTVPEQITSEKYRISDGNIFGIAPGTTAAQLLGNIKEGKYVKVFQGSTQVSGDTPVGTDMVIMLMDGDTPKMTLNVVVRGDVTGDGAIDGMDATALLQYAAGWEVPVNAQAADINGDGSADGMDATLLLQYAAGWEIEIKQ